MNLEMKFDFGGKVAVVTGAGGVLGRAMAEMYAANGAAVAVTDINEAQGRETVRLITEAGGNAEFFFHNVSDMGSGLEAAAQVIEHFGKVDILVNNAGYNVGPAHRKHIDEFFDSEWDKTVKINLDGVYNCSKAFLKSIKENSGSIVNIGSIVGLVPLRNQCAFAAAKAGVINLTKAMAIELAGDGVRVNAVCPGSVVNEELKKLFYNDEKVSQALLSHVPLGKPGEPEDIAYAVMYLSSKAAKYVTGSVLTVDGGWTCGFTRDF